MGLGQYIREKAKKIDETLKNLLAPAEDVPPQLHEAMGYSIFAGGKRLRPILVLAAAETVGGRDEDVLEAACAIELIHTYSLIHDDLPAMDDDDFRRGRLANHKVYGEAVAILAGDALLTKAFEILAHCDLPPNRDALLRQVIGEVAAAAGPGGMVGGQTVDIISEGKNIDAATLRYIHRSKTGALLRVSVRTGALLSGAGPDDLAALTRYAEEFGLVFQITDDILDVVGDDERMGKPVGTDAKRGKATYPALFGLDESRGAAREGRDKALEALKRFGPSAQPLRQLIDYVLERDN
ncbi:MAG: polyprenyl synthetase family protein [Firmicutes bacterium]|nr:polyprenyl synthetase family protein [Bacillota bacterium]